MGTAGMKRSLDPRTKLFLTMLFTIVVVLEEKPLILSGALVFILVLTLAMGLRGEWQRTLKMTLPMAGIVLAISWLAFGWQVALLVVVRLLCVVTAFFIFFQTTLPEDLGNALVKMGVPYAFAFILTTAMEFVPVIQRKLRSVIDAQRSRGIPVELSLKGLRHYPALLVPLLVSSFTLADELALAMESRGFGRPGRSFYREYKLGRWDYAALLGGIAVLLIWLWGSGRGPFS